MWQLPQVEFMQFIKFENGFLEKIKNENVIYDEKLHDWPEYILFHNCYFEKIDILYYEKY
jgi:hypothetical protein